MNTKELLRKKSFLIMSLNIIITAISFVQSTMIIRIIDIKTYGYFTIVFSFVGVIKNIFGMRTGELVLSYISFNTNKNTVYQTIKKIIKIDFLLNVLVWFFSILFGYLLRDKLHIDVKILFFYSFTVLLSIGFDVYQNIFIIYKENLKIYILSAINSFISLGITILFTYFFSIKGLIVSYLVTTILKNTFFLIESKKVLIDNGVLLNKGGESIKFNKLKEFIFHSFISTTLKSGISGVDIMYLSTFGKVEHVAMYKIAKNLAAIPGVIFGSLWSSVSPEILELSKLNSFRKLRKLINKFTSKFIGIFLLILPLILFFSEEVITFLYGNSYRETTKTFQVLFIGMYIANTFGPYIRIYSIGQNKMFMVTIFNGLTFLTISIIGYFGRDSILKMAFIVIFGTIISSLYTYLEILYKSIKIKESE